MKIRVVLDPIDPPTGIEAELDDMITAWFAEVWGVPLFGALDHPDRPNAAAADLAPLVAALDSGRVGYGAGVFSGKFSSSISKALRSVGAKWSPADKTYRIAEKDLPYALRGAIAEAKIRSEAIHRTVIQRAGEIATGVEASKSLGINFEKVARTLVKDLSSRFQDALIEASATEKAVDFVEVAPQFSEATVADVRESLTFNVELSIKEFTDEQMTEVRRLAEENLMAGGRVDLLKEILVERFGIADRKATFLAKQETSMIASEFNRARAEEIGSTEYIWHTRHDDRVRPDHQALNGTTQSWSSPPVVDKARDRHAHPGMDYGCRCTPRIILNLLARKAA